MKSSLKFREERGPLLRTKLPLKLAGIPLSSGISLGSRQDLAIEIGTFFQAGPSFKVAVKTTDRSSALALILKAGLGLWGSPLSSPLTLTAEFVVTPSCQDVSFSLRIKPRAGDFTLSRDVKFVQSDLLIRKRLVDVKEPEYVLVGHNDDLSCATPSRIDSPSMPTPPTNGGTPRRSGMQEKERIRSLSAELVDTGIGSDFSSKIERFDKEWKSRKSKVEDFKQRDMDVGESVGEMKLEIQKHLVLPGTIRKSLHGCRILAHSSLPLGGQNCVRMRWGVRPSSDMWDEDLQSFTFSKFPSLVIDKISFERVSVHPEKVKNVSSDSCKLHSELGPLPFGIDGNHDLAHVADLCYSMKRQLQLMHVENRVLRNAMEEMKSQVSFKGGPNLNVSTLMEQVMQKSTMEDGHNSGESKMGHGGGLHEQRS